MTEYVGLTKYYQKVDSNHVKTDDYNNIFDRNESIVLNILILIPS